MKNRWIVFAAAVLAASGAAVWADEGLARKSGCFECHSIDKKVVGPAFHQVAERYKDVVGAREALIETVKNGGKGHWTELSRGVPMPAHSPRLTDAEIKRLVDWVMSR